MFRKLSENPCNIRKLDDFQTTFKKNPTQIIFIKKKLQMHWKVLEKKAENLAKKKITQGTAIKAVHRITFRCLSKSFQTCSRFISCGSNRVFFVFFFLLFCRLFVLIAIVKTVSSNLL